MGNADGLLKQRAGILAMFLRMQKGAGRLVPFLKTSELCSRGWEAASQPAAGAE